MTNEEAIRYFKRHIDLYCVDGISREAEEMAIKALEQQPCDDAISREAVLEGIEELKKSPWATANRRHGYEYLITEALDVVKDLCIKQEPSVTQKSGKWIALVTRPMTNEEREYYSEQLDYCDGDVVIYNCPLPEEGQDVLITTCTGYVLIDTFFNDYDGCGFEGYDIEDVEAWMPLPKPYEPQESEDKE